MLSDVRGAGLGLGHRLLAGPSLNLSLSLSHLATDSPPLVRMLCDKNKHQRGAAAGMAVKGSGRDRKGAEARACPCMSGGSRWASGLVCAQAMSEAGAWGA